MDILSMILARNHGSKNWFYVRLSDFSDKDSFHELLSTGSMQYQYTKSNNQAALDALSKYAMWNGKYSMTSGKEDTSLPNIGIIDSTGFLVPCTFIQMNDGNRGEGNVWSLAASATIYSSGYLAKCELIIMRVSNTTSRLYFNMTMTEFTAEDSGV